MGELKWSVVLDNGVTFSGTVPGEGVVSIVCELPAGRIRSVTADMKLNVGGDDRVFVNGFQSWTYSPEYSANDRIRGLKHLPPSGVRHFGLDRYGDNYFVEYPNKKGVFHGETYAYFRRGEHYSLTASVDEKPGYTLFKIDAGKKTLHLKRDCDGMKCGGPFHAFDLIFASGSEDEVFDAWFRAMGVQPRTREKIAGYSSWYNRYEDIDEECIRSDLEHAAAYLEPGDVFQIDDGWEGAVGDWLTPDALKFPSGMAAAVAQIHAGGYRAGLWLAPFVAEKDSVLYKEHPGWFFLHEGKPWFCGCNWSGFYSLDIDHPGVREYLEKVFHRVFDEWGFDLVKLDFLYGAAPFGTENESRAGRMIRAMDYLRELCGDKLILGCGVPMAPAFGRVDYCRIGCDVGLDWDGSWLMQQTHRERVSTRQSISNTIFRRQLNGRAFLNDPDVFFLRRDNMKMSEEEKRSLAVANTLLGGVWFTSDDMGSYDDEQGAAWRELRDLRDAELIRLDFRGDVTAVYRLNGKELSQVILPEKTGKKKKS